MALTEFLTDIADAIRGKTGETEAIAAADFAAKISEIETSSGETTYTRYKSSKTLSGSYLQTATAVFPFLKTIKYVVVACVYTDTDGQPQLLFADWTDGTYRSISGSNKNIEVINTSVFYSSEIAQDISATMYFVALGVK